jgi:hypothetical protein
MPPGRFWCNALNYVKLSHYVVNLFSTCEDILVRIISCYCARPVVGKETVDERI